jgi:hypothetical protein
MIFSTLRFGFKLQELFVRTLLNFDQIWNIDVRTDARIIFSLDELLQSRFGHSYSSTLVGGEQLSSVETG